MGSVPTYSLYGEYAKQDADFWVHCETVQSRSSLHKWEIRAHRHEALFQILYLESGSGDAILSGKTVTLHPACVVTVPAGVDHGFRFSRDVEGLVVTILNTHLGQPPGETQGRSKWLAAPRVTKLNLEGRDPAYVSETLRRLAEEMENRRNGRSNLIMAYITSVLHLITRISQSDTDTEMLDEKEKRIEAFRSLIQQHFRTHRPVTYYADALGISLTHLNRVVRAALGCTAHDLVAEKMIEEAKAQLLFSPASIQEIANHLGFEDPAYFSRFFLSRAGQTPLAWRRCEQDRFTG